MQLNSQEESFIMPQSKIKLNLSFDERSFKMHGSRRNIRICVNILYVLVNIFYYFSSTACPSSLSNNLTEVEIDVYKHLLLAIQLGPILSEAKKVLSANSARFTKKRLIGGL
ncbi:hypothetical protein CU098_010018 [Rhizopus stolonifer]|uniref:Uncharacterized protein n=1 Tax=Rhizopus stolonifer TaxID=4846 RepID=A0A367KUI3_RHIST|nr:hypothetical protein CU098_010018 [Rhizopus stolonifer]